MESNQYSPFSLHFFLANLSLINFSSRFLIASITNSVWDRYSNPGILPISRLLSSIRLLGIFTAVWSVMIDF
ncbi:MAG: hypothetical protein GF383_07650 [Candidatus Lokiarchaeota archaeon]|nr:hypothetical protein [Candidatus Lokiarchaeota archaeon]